MDALEQKFQEALTQLPEKKDIEELLSQLSDVGKKSGLEISKVTPGGEAAEGFYSRIPISMAVSGNYNEVAMFLQEIANLRRIVNVSDLKLATPDRPRRQGDVELRVHGHHLPLHRHLEGSEEVMTPSIRTALLTLALGAFVGLRRRAAPSGAPPSRPPRRRRKRPPPWSPPSQVDYVYSPINKRDPFRSLDRRRAQGALQRSRSASRLPAPSLSASSTSTS